MIESAAIFAFVFVASTVAGWRLIDAIETVRAERQRARLARISGKVSRYYGPTYNRHGRPLV